MNVTLKPFDFAQAVARAGLTTRGEPIAGGKAVQGGGFVQALTQALGAVSASQNEAARLQREVQLDNPTVSLEETGGLVAAHSHSMVAGGLLLTS